MSAIYSKPTIEFNRSNSLKQRLFLRGVVCITEVLVCLLRSLATTGCTLEEALLNEEGFVDLLHGACLLANCRCHGVQANRTSVKFLDYGSQNLIIHLVETARVDVECREGCARNIDVDVSLAYNHSEVTHTAQ